MKFKEKKSKKEQKSEKKHYVEIEIGVNSPKTRQQILKTNLKKIGKMV